MPSIEVETTEIDDAEFVSLASSFVSHYASITSLSEVLVIHIDNWFGDRWLGFAGKFNGVAGMRNRSLHDTLPSPPFHPNRVMSGVLFHRLADDSFSSTPYPTRLMHFKKKGGHIWPLFSSGLHCWYSGGTANNTTGCVMFYCVTENGDDGYNNAWYTAFDKKQRWNVTRAVNVSTEECIRIANAHYDLSAT